MIVVSDTTILSTLYLIDRLDWLKDLFGAVIIPKAVEAELLELERAGYDLQVFEKAHWLKVESVKDMKLLEELMMDLDIGESEAIALTIQTMADFLLIDERKGSEIANSLRISTIGF